MLKFSCNGKVYLESRFMVYIIFLCMNILKVIDKEKVILEQGKVR